MYTGAGCLIPNPFFVDVYCPDSAHHLPPCPPTPSTSTCPAFFGNLDWMENAPPSLHVGTAQVECICTLHPSPTSPQLAQCFWGT